MMNMNEPQGPNQAGEGTPSNVGSLKRWRELRNQTNLMSQPPRFIGPPGGPTYPQLPLDGGVGNHQWEYVHRRSMQEIVPGVFLGPYAAACSGALENMLKAGLTHVVCVRHESEKTFIRPNHQAHFKYLVVSIAESLNESIIGHFNPVIEFMTDATEGGGKVLVHGNCGISRSTALVVAFLMNRFGTSAAEAFTYVQNKRFCANPNANFMRQLEEFEAIYRARHSTAAYAANADPERFSIKRTHPDEEEAEPVGPHHKAQKSDSTDSEMMEEG